MRDVLPGIAQNMVAAFHREPHLSGAPALNAISKEASWRREVRRRKREEAAD
jgi:hypothetical protein